MLTVLSAFSPGYADASNDEVNFQKLFTEWTNAFNQKQYPKVCHLFAKSVHADYQGSSQKNYAKICEGFRKIFQEKEMTYHNDFKIHHIYRSDDLAAVRITWYLNIYKNGKHMSFIQEEGLDIFQRQTNKKWEIINFIAYPVLSTQ
jgi:ketosteroid isomerase-like protein